MKTISIAEFEALVTRNDWSFSQDHDIVERMDRSETEYDSESDTLSQVDIPHAWGWAAKTATLNGVTITYTEGFNFDEYDTDSLVASTEGQDEVWKVEGVVVVDEDGDEIDAHDLADYLDGRFSAIDYSGIVSAKTNDVDVDEDGGVETITLQIDNAPDIRFTGELIGSAASSDSQAMGSSYSGQAGRWTELGLYKTAGGKYICHQIGRTRWDGERDRFSGKVCESLDEVKAFFGHRWLAKELYADAGIDAAVEVE